MSASTEALDLDSLNPGSVVDVETKSRHYRIELLGGNKVRISGHPRYCPTPTVAQLSGASGGGGALKRGLVSRGSRLVFRPFNGRDSVTTSEIMNILVEHLAPTG
jgi:hypothetical protein